MVIDKNYVKKLIGEKPVLVEIGSHHAEDLIEFAKIFPEGKLYGIEPDPRCYAIAENATKEYPCISMRQCAIGDKCDTVAFYQSSGAPDNWPGVTDWDYSGSICKPTGHVTKHSWCTFDKHVQVEQVTFDLFCRSNGITYVDFIYADVQGAEALMIKGFGSMTGHIHYLYTEFSNEEMYEGQPSYKQIRELLPGWVLCGIYDNNLLFQNTGFKK